MASIISIEKRPEASGDSSSAGEKFVQKCVEIWRVTFDTWDGVNPIMAENAALEGVWVPVHGQSLEGSGLVVTGKSAVRLREDFRVWDVSVTYSLPEPGKSEQPQAAGKWNVRISGGEQPVTEDVWSYRVDAAGNPHNGDWMPLNNSADDALQPGQKRTLDFEEIIIEYDTLLPEFSVWAACRRKCNDAEVTMRMHRPATWNGSLRYVAGFYVAWNDAIWQAATDSQGVEPSAERSEWGDVTSSFGGYRTFAEGVLYVDSIKYQTVIASNSLPATHVTIRLLIQPGEQSWATLQLVDWGYQALFGGVKRAIGADGKNPKSSINPPVNHPVFLDGAGGIMAAGSPVHRLSFPGWIGKVSFDSLLEDIAT